MLLTSKDQPKIGYKAVTLPGKKWCISELEIPYYALVYTGYTSTKEYRTDRVIPKKFLSVGKRRMILPYSMADSWFNPRFVYIKNQMVTSYLGNEVDNYGIHFFTDIIEAIVWGKSVMPGCNFRPIV
jgi:hypothetical protein